MNINLKEFFHVVWNDRKKMSIYCVASAVIGIAFAFTIPREYKASVMLAPESSSNNLSSNISSLASMVGIGLDFNSDDAIYPEIYPDLIQSVDFSLGLFPVQVTTKNGESHSYYEHLTKYKNDAWWTYPAKALSWTIEQLAPKDTAPASANSNSSTIWITKKEQKVIKEMTKIIDCIVDKKTNVIKITVKDQDALVAAAMADTIKAHLQESITNYRTNKARIDVRYFELIFEEAKKNYANARVELAKFVDNNSNVILQKVKIREEELKTEVDLAESIYTQATEQLQFAKAKVQEKTPAFCTIQSAYVPPRHNNLSKLVILIIFVLLGFTLRASILTYNNQDRIITKE